MSDKSSTEERKAEADPGRKSGADPKTEEADKAGRRSDRPSPAASVELTLASESADPGVHYLLAERETARLNGNQDRMAALDEELNGLGVRAE